MCKTTGVYNMEKERSVIGKRLPMTKLHSAIDKVQGRATYTEDVKLPNMLYAKILRSPYAHAIIEKIDISEAEKLPGVKAVITYEDVPKKQFEIERK